MRTEMKKFILIFRMDITTPGAQPAPGQMKIYMRQWGKWIKSIASKNSLAAGGSHLSVEGRVLRPDHAIIDRPYAAKKESVAGYIIIKSADFDEAVNIAKACPILHGKGTSVEVRKLEAA